MYFNYCLNAHMKEVIIKMRNWANVSSIDEFENDNEEYISMHHYKRHKEINVEYLMNKISLRPEAVLNEV